MALQVKFFDGDGFKEIETTVNQHEEKIRKVISDLGDETAQQMRDTIDQSKVRPQTDEPTTLENAIQCEHFTEGGWGVGDMEALNEQAPYWRAVNFGSFHMVGKMVPQGQFEPGEPEPNQENFREGRWKKDKGKHLFIVKNSIPAMNYIEKTINWLKTKLASFTS